MCVEVADRDLIALEGLELVIVGKSQDCTLRLITRGGAQIEVGRHALPSAWRSVVHREVPQGEAP